MFLCLNLELTGNQLHNTTNKKHNVMIKKTYENPESELIFVKIEENFLTSDPNAVRSNSASSGYNGDYDLGDDI